jgi:hypothetical protein
MMLPATTGRLIFGRNNRRIRSIALEGYREKQKMIRIVGAVSAMVVVLGWTTAGFAQDFSAAVQTVLSKQKEITELDADRQVEMIACANRVLAEVPGEKQRYVAEAANFDEMESRFGEVVLADRAEFKQKITKECGSIVMEQ